jgi:hypothetical protein
MEIKRNSPINREVADDLESNRTDKISRVVKKDGQLARSPELIAMPPLCWSSTCDPLQLRPPNCSGYLTPHLQPHNLLRKPVTQGCGAQFEFSTCASDLFIHKQGVSGAPDLPNRESCSFSPWGVEIKHKISGEESKQLLTSTQNAHRFFHHTDTISQVKRWKKDGPPANHKFPTNCNAQVPLIIQQLWSLPYNYRLHLPNPAARGAGGANYLETQRLISAPNHDDHACS